MFKDGFNFKHVHLVIFAIGLISLLITLAVGNRAGLMVVLTYWWSAQVVFGVLHAVYAFILAKGNKQRNKF